MLGGMFAAPIRPGGSWQSRYAYPDWKQRMTRLPADQEAQFQAWASQRQVQPSGEYDMRGYFLHRNDPTWSTEINPNDHLTHYPDAWKTPLAPSFSNESIYADPRTGPPHWNNRDQLVLPNGTIVYDEREEAARRNGNAAALGYLPVSR